MPVLHIPKDRLEKYVLDHILNETELAEIEEHLLWCEYCLDYVEDMERFLKALKVGTKLGGFDVEVAAEEYRRKRNLDYSSVSLSLRSGHFQA